MHVVLLLALLTIPAFAFAQADPAKDGSNPPRMAGDLEPAPVPSNAAGGGAAAVPERIAPAGVGNNIAGPANATPFSSTPSANMPNSRDTTQSGAGVIVPNTSK